MKVRVATSNPAASEVINGVVFAPFSSEGLAGAYSEEISEEVAASFLRLSDFRKVNLKEKDVAALEKLLERSRAQASASGAILVKYVDTIKDLEKTNNKILKENQQLREIAQELIEEQNAKGK